MQIHQLPDGEDTNYQSTTYLGRPIAILNRGGRWHVYLALDELNATTPAASPNNKEKGPGLGTSGPRLQRSVD